MRVLGAGLIVSVLIAPAVVAAARGNYWWALVFFVLGLAGSSGINVELFRFDGRGR